MWKTKVLGHLSAILTVSAWGTSFVATDVLMKDDFLTPIQVYLYRFALAYLILLAITYKKIRANNLKDEALFLLCGVCAGSLYYILENYALKNTTAGNVSLLSSLSPLMITILMVVVFKARLRAGMVIGSVIAFIGVGFVIFSHGTGIELHPLGDILAITSSLSWAIYAIGVKKLVDKYSSLFITRKLFFYGVLTALPILLAQGGPSHLVQLFTSPAHLSNMLFLVIVCSVLGYVGWNYAFTSIGAVATNNYIYLQPLATMVVAYFVLGEEISTFGYIGCILIISGLIISDKLGNFVAIHRK